jgi:hypothetical protein
MSGEKNYLEILGEKKKSKYGAEKTGHAGYSFASKLEAAVFDYLKMLEAAGEVRDIQCQNTIYLTRARISYRADFKAYDIKKTQNFSRE